MDTSQFSSGVHPVSGRGAVFEKEDGVAFLYLTQSANGKIIGHVLACAGSGDLAPSFRWSGDGRSVAVLERQQAVAFILDGEPLGYGRYVVMDGPTGHPWDEAKFVATFRRR